MSNLIGDSDELRCPVCNFEYNHIQSVFTRKGIDENEATVYDGTKAIGTVNERRSCLVIQLRCEGDHFWELQLQQHKGNVFVRANGIEASDVK